ncbi:MAG: sigma factor-like helix-turn-helix DNA-binding protein [Clostridia bacterium]|nr:sigma factor-like helix-turn-helix DNA-binding protein [Clostridia bacterium]
MKKLEISVLNDYYGGLLNGHQTEIMRLYYDCDMSLAEIAAETGITRQGVREVLLRGAKRIEEYESKLGLVNKVKNLAERLEAIIEGTPEGAPQRKELEELQKSIKEL